MFKPQSIVTVQPLSVQLPYVVLYQDEQLKVLSVNKGYVKVKRLSNGTVITLSVYELKAII